MTRRRFASVAASVPAARRFAAGVLGWLPADVLDAVLVVVSELVTNAVVHGRSAVDVQVDGDPGAGRVRVAVTDAGGGRPRTQRPGPEESHGRGLQIVEALADLWGVEPAASGRGKTVWAELAVGAPSPT